MRRRRRKRIKERNIKKEKGRTPRGTRTPETVPRFILTFIWEEIF